MVKRHEPMSDNQAPTIPAVIWCDPVTGSLRIAALTLLDRLVVALHRAGCGPIRIVCPGPLPVLRRAPALGIAVDAGPLPVAMEGPVVLAKCEVVVQPGDVRAVIRKRGRLSDSDGRLLPLGCVERFAVADDMEAALNRLPSVAAVEVSGLAADAESAARMGRRLWSSLSSSTDGMVDKYFNRPFGRFLSKALVHTPVTPNQVTVASAAVGLVGAWYFAVGDYVAGIVGAILLQFSALIDCVDGEVARIAFKESPIGKWLDLGLDQVVHVAVFAALAVGLGRGGSDAPVMWLGLSAVVGAIISFPVVVRARRLSNQEDSKLEKFIDAASTRDFTALLVFLAVIGRLEWFLWLTGITVHLFWVTALVLQLPKRAPSQTTGSDA